MAQRIERPRIRSTRYVDTGSAGFLALLKEAEALLKDGRCTAVVAGVVDSLVSPEALAWLDEHDRLKTPEMPIGLTPGEAAAFVVLETESTAEKRKARIRARVGHVTYLHSRVDDSMDLGERNARLSGCIRETIAAMSARGLTPRAVFCTLNGEIRPRLRVGCCAHDRLRRPGAAPLEMGPSVADCIGDTGCCYQRPAHLPRRRRRRAQAAELVSTSRLKLPASDLGERGAGFLWSGP